MPPLLPCASRTKWSPQLDVAHQAAREGSCGFVVLSAEREAVEQLLGSGDPSLQQRFNGLRRAAAFAQASLRF